MSQLELGGFFPLEIGKRNQVFHNNTAIRLVNGRSAIYYFLQTYKPRRIWLPYYCCDSILLPLIKEKIDYQFIPINTSFEFEMEPDLDQCEYLLCINYFGLMSHYITKLILKYKSQLIVDNTHNFFAKSLAPAFSFNSCRKFFGVPDGAYVYDPKFAKNRKLRLKKNFPVRYNYLIEKYLSKSTAYKLYVESEKKQPVGLLAMSPLTEKILETVDYKWIIQRRVNNFNYYIKELGSYNAIHFELRETTPFCYPFLPKSKTINKEKLWDNKHYIPILWKECLTRISKGYLVEKNISENLLPLPVDHRYSPKDLRILVKYIKQLI